jgi:hypothetical protein
MQKIGYRMAAIADYVSAVPGCSKAQALRGVGLPDRGLVYLRPIDRTLAAGLVICEHVGPTRCRLFATEVDQRLWHLRRELLGTPTAERSAEILAEVDKIRAAQARAYAEAQQV